MSGKPSYIDWIPNNTTGITAPSGGKLATGWLSAEKPPFQYMNWFFNLVSQWVNQAGPGAYDVIIGSGGTAKNQYATLTAAIADAGLGTNLRVLVTESLTLASTITLSKAGWVIDFAPGISYTAGAATTAFSITASGVQIRGARFVNFTYAVLAAVGWTYGRVLFSNFLNCTNEVDDTLSPAGKKPVTLGNISEV